MAKRGRSTNAEREAMAAGEIMLDSQNVGAIVADAVRENAGGIATAVRQMGAEAIDVSDAVSSEDLAVTDLGLLPEQIASRRMDGTSVVIVTRGGAKLCWPQDIERAKALTQSQKDGQFPGGVNANSKAWHEPAEKNAALVAALAAQQKGGE